MVTRKYIVDIGLGDPLTYEVDDSVGDRHIAVRADGDDDWQHVSLDQTGIVHLFLLTVDERSREVYLERQARGVRATVDRHVFDVEVLPWTPTALDHRRSSRSSAVRAMTAPMTGSVVEVFCTTGQSVAAGEVLLVIESMKMNNEIRAPRDVVVDQVPVGPGDKVSAGQVLVSFVDGQ
jgi:biotin carboxyl carrier protein